MRVLLYGRYGEYPKEIEGLVKKAGLEIIDPSAPLGMTTPDVVVTYGGDGTLIGAERDYPEIPKLPLKNSDRCVLCATVPNDQLLHLIRDDKLKIKQYSKLEAKIGDKILLAANDVVIRNSQPNIALRFTVQIYNQSTGPSEGVTTTERVLRNDEQQRGGVEGPQEYIGDGLVVSTPVGSTGYYYSITRQPVKSGIGLAFNNIHNQDPVHKILSETDQIEVVITRGPAVLAVDNNPETLNLGEGAEIQITASNQKMKLLLP